MKAFHQFFTIKRVRRFEHLLFNFLSFSFFKNSDGGMIATPKLLLLISLIPYLLTQSTMTVFGEKRYFVKLKEHIVGVFALREKPEVLYIGRLAVAPNYRRLGIGTDILYYLLELAKRMDKKWLELSVLKQNVPALQLYEKFGFVKKKEKKRSWVLKKKVEVV